MAAVQTTYPNTQPIAYAGMPATMHGWDADSKIVETPAGIAFARAVGKGTGVNQIVIAAATGFIGVTYRDITLLPRMDAFIGYPQYSTAGVMVTGDIWVDVYEAVVAGGPVQYNAAGRFGAAAGTAVPNARWMRSASALGELALLRL